MNDPQQQPTSEREALERYAHEHIGDAGHEPNAPRAKRGDLATYIFDTLLAANRSYAEQLKAHKP